MQEISAESSTHQLAATPNWSLIQSIPRLMASRIRKT